jgi:hypothetical protein
MEFVPAANIGEVIIRLDAVIAKAIAEKDPIGIFPALYVMVTEKVRDAIAAGNVFEDNARMEQLDVVFANRYLQALHEYQQGKKPSGAWLAAFRASENGKNQLILQYLLMGMNAHINLDLGIAAAETSPGPAIGSLHRDFNTINQILASLVDVVKGDLERFSPRFKWIINHVSGEDAILEFSMTKARDAAWKFASKLAPEPQADWAKPIELRDLEMRILANAIRRPGIIGSLLVWWVRLKETKDVPFIINELRNSYGQRVGMAQFQNLGR